ncbi:unnamed protein product [Rangifer tarandus platyrhynchus]|uniref:Uncharacterized protein n=1 Tax=Rangifer tarandus platyrhynchus TaxID=3082113 RepID=A0AC59ZRT5_RANTA
MATAPVRGSPDVASPADSTCTRGHTLADRLRAQSVGRRAGRSWNSVLPPRWHRDPARSSPELVINKYLSRQVARPGAGPAAAEGSEVGEVRTRGGVAVTVEGPAGSRLGARASRAGEPPGARVRAPGLGPSTTAAAGLASSVGSTGRAPSSST